MNIDVGYFRDPKSNQIVAIRAKEGESNAEAIERVSAEHGVPPSAVVSDKKALGEETTGTTPPTSSAPPSPPDEAKGKKKKKGKKAAARDKGPNPRALPLLEQRLRVSGLAPGRVAPGVPNPVNANTLDELKKGGG